jgi:mono/diheme cytochrome c family protein
MKQALLGAVAFGATMALPFLSYAQSEITAGGGVDVGQREYSLSCAACHGKTGKGDGPLVELLTKTPTDLTEIQKNAGAVFPFDRLYTVIDGREMIAAHGSREMPVWGDQFRMDAAELGRGFPLTESLVRGRIVALIFYIYTLQNK